MTKGMIADVLAPRLCSVRGLTVGLSKEKKKPALSPHCQRGRNGPLFQLADSGVLSRLTSLNPMIPKRVHHRNIAPMSSVHSHSNSDSDAFEARLLNEKSEPITSPGTDKLKQKWGHHCLNVSVTAWGVVIGL